MMIHSPVESHYYNRPEIPTHEQICNATVLIVDDVALNITIIKEILTRYGLKHFFIASNGQEALEITKQYRPDVVVLDLVMPIMDGFEYCRQIKSDPALRNTPIIVQTALTIPLERKRAFEAGATDFVGKPIDPDELTARLHVHLERTLLFKSLECSEQRMAAELHAASRMQHVLLPDRQHLDVIRQKSGIDIQSHFQPSTELGGDIWGTRLLEGGKLSFYLIDFSGHGVTAALNTFRLHTLMDEYHHLAANPGSYLTQLNQRLAALLPVGQYATMFYGVLDIANDHLNYAVAASPKPILYNANDQAIVYIDTRAFPLGIMPDASYGTQTIPFRKGDSICTYSDALIETKNNAGDYLTEEQIASIIKSNAGNPQASFDSLMEKFNSEYMRQLEDDFTLNILRRRS